MSVEFLLDTGYGPEYHDARGEHCQPSHILEVAAIAFKWLQHQDGNALELALARSVFNCGVEEAISVEMPADQKAVFRQIA